MKKLILALALIKGGFMIAQTKTVVTVNGEKIQVNPNSVSTADNGLNSTAGNVQLGGVLLKPTTVTATASNTLAIAGLQTGSGSDNVLVADSNGVLKWVSRASFVQVGDNLGNHIAGDNLDMTSHNVNNVKGIYFKDVITSNTSQLAVVKSNGLLNFSSDKNGNASLFSIDESTKKTIVDNFAISKGTDGLAPAAGYIATSLDTNGNVVWKSPSSIVAGSQVQGDWNMATTTDPSYIKNKPTIPTVTGAETKITAGTNVTVTGTGATGTPYVINATSTADNLGNHTATTDLNMSAKNITAANNITAAGTVNAANTTVTTKTTTQTAAITKGTDGSTPAAGYIPTSVDGAGNIKWTDPSTITTKGDNLGNHTATTTLDMAKNTINNVNTVYFTDQVGANTNKYGIYKNNGSFRFWSDKSGGDDFSIDETTRKTTVNNLSIGKGTDGSAPAAGFIATSLDSNGNIVWKSPSSVQDNLGDHKALMDLNMNAKNISAANNITATGKTVTNMAQIAKGTDGNAPAVGNVATAADVNGNIIWQAIPKQNIVPTDVGTVISVGGQLVVAQEITALMTADFVIPFNNNPMPIGNISNVIIDNKSLFTNNSTANSFKVADNGIYSVTMNVQYVTASGYSIIGVWCDTDNAWVARIGKYISGPGEDYLTLITAINMSTAKTYSFRYTNTADVTIKAMSSGSTGTGPVSFYSLKRLK